MWLRLWAGPCRETAIGLANNLAVKLFVLVFTKFDHGKEAAHRQQIEHVLEHLLMVDFQAPVLERQRVMRFDEQIQRVTTEKMMRKMTHSTSTVIFFLPRLPSGHFLVPMACRNGLLRPTISNGLRYIDDLLQCRLTAPMKMYSLVMSINCRPLLLSQSLLVPVCRTSPCYSTGSLPSSSGPRMPPFLHPSPSSKHPGCPQIACHEASIRIVM